MQQKKKPKSPLKNWAIFSTIAFQMGGTVFACAWAGRELDERYGNPEGTQWFTLGLVLFGVGASIFLVLRQLKKFNDSDGETD